VHGRPHEGVKQPAGTCAPALCARATQHIGDAAQLRGRMSGSTSAAISRCKSAGARPRAPDLCGTMGSAAWFVPQGIKKKSFYTSSMIFSRMERFYILYQENLGEEDGGK
jgi:hypothetical protein